MIAQFLKKNIPQQRCSHDLGKLRRSTFAPTITRDIISL
jgi:hypothetical protein